MQEESWLAKSLRSPHRPGEQKPTARLSKKQRVIFTVALALTLSAVGVYTTVERNDLDFQALPMASILGGMAASMLLAPVAYWLSGRFGKMKMRPKETPHQDESESKVLSSPLRMAIERQTLDTLANQDSANHSSFPENSVNRRQLLAIKLGIGLIILMGVVPPWRETLDIRAGDSQVYFSKVRGYSFIFEPPEPQYQYGTIAVDFGRLALQFTVSAIGILGSVWICRREPVVKS